MSHQLVARAGLPRHVGWGDKVTQIIGQNIDATMFVHTHGRVRRAEVDADDRPCRTSERSVGVREFRSLESFALVLCVGRDRRQQQQTRAHLSREAHDHHCYVSAIRNTKRSNEPEGSGRGYSACTARSERGDMGCGRSVCAVSSACDGIGSWVLCLHVGQMRQ